MLAEASRLWPWARPQFQSIRTHSKSTNRKGAPVRPSAIPDEFDRSQVADSAKRGARGATIRTLEREVMKKSCSVLLALATVIGMSAAAMAASVGGTVAGSQGQSVSGITVIVKDASGHVVGQGTPGASGAYDITGLPEGNYTFTLDPGSSGLQGQTVSSYVGPDGICLNWGVSTTSPAVASAQPGSTCTPLAAAWWDDPAVWVGAGAVLVAGAAIGVVAAESGPDHNHKSASTVGQ
jgi:hypothetical protein